MLARLRGTLKILMTGQFKIAFAFWQYIGQEKLPIDFTDEDLRYIIQK